MDSQLGSKSTERQRVKECLWALDRVAWVVYGRSAAWLNEGTRAGLSRTMSFASTSLRQLRLGLLQYNRARWSTRCAIRCMSANAEESAQKKIPDSLGDASVEPKDPKVEQLQAEASIPIPDAAEGKEKAPVIPLLQRPLGVKYRPTTVAKTWREEMMDDDTRKEHRDKLLKEATKGYFTDLNATRRFGGKTWIAPRVLIREDKARYFPDIEGTAANGNKKVHTTDLLLGKISIVCMLSSKISEFQTEEFYKPTVEEYSKNPHFQLIQINLQENLLKALLVQLFSRSIRNTIPPEQWSKYLISNQNMDYLREDIGMTNRHLGYVYLVDQACRIRWAGCADPMVEEIKALHSRVPLTPSTNAAGILPQDPGYDRDGRRPQAWRDDLETLIAGDWEWEDNQISNVERGENGVGSGPTSIYNVGKAKAASRSAVREDPGIGLTEGVTAGEQSSRWESNVPETKTVAHVPGYTILDNVFMLNGTCFLVTDTPSSIPPLTFIASSSSNSNEPPRERDWRTLNKVTAQTILGAFGGRIRGTTWLATDASNSQDPYTLFSLLRANSYLGTPHTTSAVSPSGLHIIYPDPNNMGLGGLSSAQARRN
ncbi:hypothetical protein NM688_g6941 [Phlebia brevispora]|uniref:Uncharacterized protein n=1 Tax=Phlebia brevispora TaxID=194682 RepID=A0ACC1SAU2_9APHY|nr:hypothetical protein NM688_g6941 [Phlebia brevispora]